MGGRRYSRGMEQWMVIVSGIAAVGSVVAAAVAILQAKDARAAEKRALEAQKASEVAAKESAELASKATAAFVESAAQTKRLADLKERELAVPVWSGPKWVTGDLYRMTNTSDRVILVKRTTIDPDEAIGRFQLHAPESQRYETGDSWDFLASTGGRHTVRKINVYWHYEDEPDDDLNELIIPL